MKNKSQNTESSATDYLQWYYYNNCGNKHLGWDFGEFEVHPDGSETVAKPAGPRWWTTPTGEKRLRWKPVWAHLNGNHRGICRNVNETFIPFVTVDLDRHDGAVPAKQHIHDVIKTGRLLREHFGRLRWLVEVNPNNGSSKFFGFTGSPIRAEIAKEIGRAVREKLEICGLGPREVFPDNSPQVILPMRMRKITIIDSGVLPSCIRRRKAYDGVDEFGRPEGHGFENFEAYSALAFVRWLRHGSHYDEPTLIKTLVSACGNLPDESVEAAQSKNLTKPPALGVGKPSHCNIPQDEPDSFVRQREALLKFCRTKRRVVSVEEGLCYIRDDGLFTGTWEKNYVRRCYRVRQILDFVAKTFDPALCGGIGTEIQIGKYDDWAARHCPFGWRAPTKGHVDEYGQVFTHRDRNVADQRFVSIFLSIAEFMMIADKNMDGSVPHVRAEALWNMLHSQGLVDVAFCPRKWAIVRNELEKRGIITVNHVYFRGQAMKWHTGTFFPGLGLWKMPKQRGLLEPVSLAEFLGVKRVEEEEVHNAYLQQRRDYYGSFNGSGRGPPPEDGFEAVSGRSLSMI
jgi:hypothetical protein